MSRFPRPSISRRPRAVAFVAVLSLVAYAAVGFAAPEDALAAGNASVSITPATTTTESGVTTTYTMSYTCSVTGGCPAAVVTFPTTALTGDGPTTDFGPWLNKGTCPNLTVASGIANISFGIIATGTCAFTVRPPEYTTYNNTRATITPTISGTGFSATGSAVTLTGPRRPAPRRTR